MFTIDFIAYLALLRYLNNIDTNNMSIFPFKNKIIEMFWDKQNSKTNIYIKQIRFTEKNVEFFALYLNS